MNLNSGSDDEPLKLVRYRIFYTERGSERLLLEAEEVVNCPVDEPTFAAWKIAEFIHNKAPDLAIDLSGKNKKYLKCSCEVIATYPRETFQSPRRQDEILADLARKF